MPKRDELSIKIDYLSVIFEAIQAKELIERIMELPFEIFHVQKARIKHQPYTRLYQCGTIKIYGDAPPIETNPLGLGCYLVLSGKGCDDYFGRFGFHSDKDIYYDFFAKCKARLKNKFHLTRLDVANAEPYFTIEQIKKKCLKEEFISKSRSYRFAESSFEDGETAKTVYIGDGKSNLSIRFYDKDKEVCGKYQIPYEEVGSWKRTELQLRDETAHEFAMLMALCRDELGQLAFDLLGSSLRFITREKGQINKSRWKTCWFWERFLGAIKPLKLTIEKTEHSLYETQRWLQEGGALSAVKVFCFLQYHNALGELEDIETLMKHIQYSPALSHKLVTHLQHIGREELIPLVYEETKK